MMMIMIIKFYEEGNTSELNICGHLNNLFFKTVYNFLLEYLST